MKRKSRLALVIVGSLMALSLIGCSNYTLGGSMQYDHAMVKLPNGEIVEGEVESWGEITDSMMHITIGNTTYLTSANNVVLTTTE